MNQTLFNQESAVEFFCNKTNYTLENIRNKCRKQQYVFMRMILASYLRKNGYTLQHIGKIINKDHTTIIYYEHNFGNFLVYDKTFRELYNKTQELLNA